ncbi:MAG: response regulator [Kangiellaceae bacterium]|nr:response regulator [Kangiellaceae bacterium]
MKDYFKILIVDDEPNNLKLLQQILKDEYQLMFANNGMNAIKAVANHKPDLILLDIMMPDMTGYEVCQQLKLAKETRDIPIIFVTAMGDQKDETKGFDVGGVDYIQKPVSGPIVLRRVKTHLTLVRAAALEDLAKASVKMLGEAGHYNDTDTGEHIWRMASYSAALARAAGWTKNQADTLELAAPMHDTGKIGIPDRILKSPGKLDGEDWSMMKQHSQIGYDILTKSPNPLFQMAAEIALGHHERWDGSGYPNHRVGVDIVEHARIVAIADVFDALTTKRPYKEAWSVEDAVEEIQRNAGSHFDPKLVDLFVKILPEILRLKQHWGE